MPYNLSTMQSIFCNNKEITEIRYNGSLVYSKSEPVGPYQILYTSTDNQIITPYTTSGLNIIEHTFSNNVGKITLSDQTPVLPSRFWQNRTTLRTIKYGANLTFHLDGYQHNGCTALESAELPANLTTIVQRLFRENPLLTLVNIPATVNTIYTEWPFFHTNLQNGTYIGSVLIFHNPTPPAFATMSDQNGHPFSPTWPNTIINTVYVPSSSLMYYRNTQYFSDIPNVMPIQ